jgi:hypothetical protein
LWMHGGATSRQVARQPCQPDLQSSSSPSPRSRVTAQPNNSFANGTL